MQAHTVSLYYHPFTTIQTQMTYHELGQDVLTR